MQLGVCGDRVHDQRNADFLRGKKGAGGRRRLRTIDDLNSQRRSHRGAVGKRLGEGK